MIKHLVLWRLKDNAEGNNKVTNAQLAKEKLEALNGVIPGLIKLEVGKDFLGGEMACDIAIYAEIESREALTSYQQHPAHKAAAAFVISVSEERRVVDYEV